MAPRRIEVIFGEGQNSEDLLLEAVYGILNPEPQETQNDSDSGKAA